MSPLRLIAASTLTLFAVGLGSPALAIPPGGASSDTPGTSSTVSPTRLAPGDRISFTVKGFPAGETIYVKIDDGENCADTSQGGCVYHQQKIPSSGVVRGSFALPQEIEAGAHWLRFLASKQIFNADGSFKGIQGYTLRGGADFTIVAATEAKAGANAKTPSTAPTQAGTATQAPAAPVTTRDTGTLSLGEATGTAAATAPTAAATAGAETVAAVAPVSRSDQPSANRPLPVIGTITLGVAIALAAGALGWVAARSGRRA